MTVDSVSIGDSVVVEYEEVVYEDGGRTEKRVTREDTGEVTAAPSRKFDWELDDFAFDYELDRGNAVRSVDENAEVVAQLMYDAGGDRDWKEWNLVSVSVQ